MPFSGMTHSYRDSETHISAGETVKLTFSKHESDPSRGNTYINMKFMLEMIEDEPADHASEAGAGTPYTEDFEEEVSPENRFLNPGFEADDLSMWNFTSDPVPDSSYEIFECPEDAHSGSRFFLYRNRDNTVYVMEQTLTNLDPGVYEASVFSQGNNSPEGNGYVYLIVETEHGSYVDVIHNTEYGEWHQAYLEGIEINSRTVRVELQIYCEADCWGILDDFPLHPDGWGTERRK